MTVQLGYPPDHIAKQLLSNGKFLGFRRDTIGLIIVYPQLNTSMGPIKSVKLSQTKTFDEEPAIPNEHIPTFTIFPYGSAAVPDDHIFCMELD